MALIGISYPKVPYSGITSADWNQLIEALQRGEKSIKVKNVGLANTAPSTPDAGFIRITRDGDKLKSTDESGFTSIISHASYDTSRVVEYQGLAHTTMLEDIVLCAQRVYYDQVVSIKGKYTAKFDTPKRDSFERFAFGFVTSIRKPSLVNIHNTFANEAVLVRSELPSMAVAVDDSEVIQYYEELSGNVQVYTSGSTVDLSAGVEFEFICAYNSVDNDFDLTLKLDGIVIVTGSHASPVWPVVLVNQTCDLSYIVMKVENNA